MTLPRPERGLVISYAYLWHREHVLGREDGAKDRPCVVVLAVEAEGGDFVVTVAPVTHAIPSTADAAIEIPVATKRRLGLDDAPSWILVGEGNRFVWPGPDSRPIDSGVFAYGFLPPALFQRVPEKSRTHAVARRVRFVPRSD